MRMRLTIAVACVVAAALLPAFSVVRELVASRIGAIEIAEPISFAQRIVTPRDVACLRQDPANREFGDRTGISSGRVDYADLPLARRPHVDVHWPAARDGDES